jgi:nitrite reductase/ring-hydroxylating ferredoxin subunit
MDEQGRPAGTERDRPRRSFLTTLSGALMAVGLALGYGTFGVMLARFVYPAASRNRGWMFVCTAASLGRGEAINFTAPAGARIVIARQGPGTGTDDFLALSSVCPHLGCQVHWEPQHDRFFCPCHNGAFDRSGNAIAGPPKAANQTLVRFPLKVENGLLYVEAPLTSLTSLTAARQPDAGRRLS